jgi:hypothetical protein
VGGDRADDVYRRAEAPPGKRPLTIRWSNLNGYGVAGGCFISAIVLFTCVFLGAVAAIGTVDVLRAREAWWQLALTGLVLLVMYALTILLALFVFATGGVTIDPSRAKIVRFGGILFVPILRSTYRLDANTTVRVESKTYGGRGAPIVTFTAHIICGDKDIELRSFDRMDRAEEQAQRIRAYLEEWYRAGA